MSAHNGRRAAAEAVPSGTAPSHPRPLSRSLAARIGAGRLIPVAIGMGVVAAGTASGWDARLVSAIATPPTLVRAALAALGVVVGVRLLGAAVTRLAASEPVDGERDLVALTRGVRIAFLAVAAFAAAAGWLLGHPLPIVAGLIIAGVDVVETSFLLLVIATRRT